jgi:hypothetical protein
MRKLVALLAIAMQVGCMTVTNKPEDLRAEGMLAAKVCSSESVDVALSRIEAGWQRCFGAQTADGAPIMLGTSAVGFIQGSGPTFVVVRQTPSSNSGSVVVREARKQSFVWLLADVQQTSTCNAEISLRGTNIFWRSRAEQSKVLLEDPSAKCPTM